MCVRAKHGDTLRFAISRNILTAEKKTVSSGFSACLYFLDLLAVPPFNQNGALQSGQQINGRKMLLTVGQMMSCFTENETFFFLSCLSEL